ncbi:DUF11 domain-containing protein [Actinosynnema sp. NPDC047251]|uniref:DUF11 domain-containing protein n=1 Tax=Saccharothrix espanaensis TaxID=103731 RepID=UPI0002E8B31F|nr:DUF11 domain-containing protein [Saccharothrix espanaensis]
MTEGLSISIDNAHDQVHGGDELAYKITVRNTGSSDVEGLRVTQSVPPGVRVVTADQDGRTSETSVQWTASIPAGEDVTLTDKVVFDAAPDGTARLASSVCAYRTGETRPVVCSTDSDQLAATPPALAKSPMPWWPLVVAVVVLALAAGVFVVLRRRRRDRVAG